VLKVCIPLYDLTGLQVEDPGTTSNPTYATLTTPDFIVIRVQRLAVNYWLQ